MQWLGGLTSSRMLSQTKHVFFVCSHQGAASLVRNEPPLLGRASHTLDSFVLDMTDLKAGFTVTARY